MKQITFANPQKLFFVRVLTRKVLWINFAASFKKNARVRAISKMKNIETAATHNGVFHPDEVIAAAILRTAFPNITIVRTRDEKTMSECDIRFDVGGKYSPSDGDFDHHQDRMLPASCNLVWDYYGEKVISKITPPNPEIHQYVLDKLLNPISGLDCDFQRFIAENPKGVYMTVGDVILGFNRPELDEETQFFQFMTAVSVAEQILLNTVLAGAAEAEIADVIRNGEQIAEFATLYEKGFLYNDWRFDPNRPKRPFVANLLVMPQPDRTWAVVSLDTTNFNLASASGEGLVFAHKAGFFAKWATREQAVAYASEKSEKRSQVIDRWVIEHNDGNGCRR